MPVTDSRTTFITKRDRGQFTGIVTANIVLCREHYKLSIQIEDFPKSEPGQFIQLACRGRVADIEDECEGEWVEGAFPRLATPETTAPLAMLRRPFSLAGRVDAGGSATLEIIHRVVGIGTDWLSRLVRGDEVGLIGPLGNRFTLPAQNQEAILVGGGVGIPPMLYLASKLSDKRAVAFCGATTRDLLPFTLGETPREDAMAPAMRAAEFAEHGVASVLTTDDGSFGVRGFVTQALETYLDKSPDAKRIIYTCGPEPMMKRVADIALKRGIACEIAVERAMACGMGTCQSCVIRTKAAGRADGRDWVYRLACTDGPIFSASQLLW